MVLPEPWPLVLRVIIGLAAVLLVAAYVMTPKKK
jgi:hypothetical protein